MTPLIENIPRVFTFFIGLGMGILLGLLIALTAVRNIARRREHQAHNNSMEKSNGK